MDLFSQLTKEEIKRQAPLADRMRPRTLEEFYGQSQAIGEQTVLRQLILNDRVPSMILYGPPGSGKTTLASVIANLTKARFLTLSAVTSGVADIRTAIERSKEERILNNRKTILFIDEVHRFNKAQQDALLPHVEDGTIILIGATTENPMFSVNKALLSRCRIIELKHLKDEDIKRIINDALKDKERGLGEFQVDFEENFIDNLIIFANGDARQALNTLELCVLASPRKNNVVQLTNKILEDIVQKPILNYTKGGDEHYDVISAFIKSVRGSDPDAAIYYLARMLYAGEDPLFIARRLIILAAEDIGLADPYALTMAISAAEAVNRIGLPEGRIPLAEATIYLSLAPKSNSAYLAIDKALKYVETHQNPEIPRHLRDGSRGGKEALGFGQGYLYPHDYPNHYVKQRYLPKTVDEVFYKKSELDKFPQKSRLENKK
ncbi:MAG TPA: replication-associated recombination protein A [Firmicutes bacterium]|nr:replication-associated recombination protein A [Bacillota bacterium]